MTKIISLIHYYKNTKENSSSKDNELRSIYYALVEMIIQGKYEDTAEALNELRDQKFTGNEQVEAIRRLIATRLSMKRGDPGDNTLWISMPVPEESWIAAEKSLVQGHWNYHLQQFQEGIECFEESERRFKKLEMSCREFVSAFNVIIGEVSGSKELLPLDQLEKLRALELRVLPYMEKQDCARVQAMIYRQKAHAFEDLNRFHASLEEITKAIAIFELNGPISDYQLAVLHAADIYLDLKENFKARAFFEYVTPPVDARVEFPLAFISWRLGGRLPDKQKFSVMPSGWKEKFDKLKRESENNDTEKKLQWSWSRKTEKLIAPHLDKPLVIKLVSLEGRLLRLLIQQKATKNLLIETLWPMQSDSQLLDNRLHRMISRLNKKLDNVISYDGKYYSLKVEINP